MKSKYVTSMVNGDIVLELEEEIKRLTKALQEIYNLSKECQELCNPYINTIERMSRKALNPEE